MKMKLFLAPLVFLTALCSCNHKNLCYMEMQKTKIVVEYDWRDAPEANPAGMCVFFYSMDNDNYYRFDFSNTKGGEIEIPVGKYLLITYNNDTELVRFSGTNHFGTHTAYTREGDILEPLYGNGVTSTAKALNNERVCIVPDALWGCHVSEVDITAGGVSYIIYPYDDAMRAEPRPAGTTDTQTITLYPHDMLCHYSYEVRNVDNIEYISKLSASLSGMVPKLKLADESLDNETITIPFGGKVDVANKKITGQFLTFGHTDNNTIAHKMTFFVIMTDGSKYRIENYDNLNVTSQVDNAPDRRHVHIIIDGLKVPHTKDDGGGWNPSVDDWGVNNEDIFV